MCIYMIVYKSLFYWFLFLPVKEASVTCADDRQYVTSAWECNVRRSRFVHNRKFQSCPSTLGSRMTLNFMIANSQVKSALSFHCVTRRSP